MTAARDFSKAPPFFVVESQQQRVPFVFNSPHSGSAYPRPFLAATRLDETRAASFSEVATLIGEDRGRRG